MSRDRTMALLADGLLHRYPGEAALQLERMPTAQTVGLLERLEAPLAADALRRVRGDRAAEVVRNLSGSAASKVLGALEPASAAAILSRLDPDDRAARLASLDQRLARELEELMAYPPSMAGAIMNPRVPAFRAETTAREALSQLRASRTRMSDIFVVDDESRLVGEVSVQELALAESSTRLDELMVPSPARVQALSPRDELVAVADDPRTTSLAVVDISDRLLGVISRADLLGAVQRDATADVQAMVGASREERALSSAWFAVRKRLPWLQINLVTAFLAAAVVGAFEGTIARFTALAVLLPVVAGQSGNTGAQALAVTMRGLALREIRVRHWFRVARKELVAGTVNGIAVAAVTSAGVYVWSQSAGIAAVIGVSMVCSMIVAGVAGASVPVALTLLKQDPAAASSIVLTTVTDVMGFLTFLGFATLAAGML